MKYYVPDLRAWETTVLGLALDFSETRGFGRGELAPEGHRRAPKRAPEHLTRCPVKVNRSVPLDLTLTDVTNGKQKTERRRRDFDARLSQIATDGCVSASGNCPGVQSTVQRIVQQGVVLKGQVRMGYPWLWPFLSRFVRPGLRQIPRDPSNSVARGQRSIIKRQQQQQQQQQYPSLLVSRKMNRAVSRSAFLVEGVRVTTSPSSGEWMLRCLGT